MKLKKRLKGLVAFALAIFCMMQLVASAAGYQSYTYNAYYEPVYSADMYNVSEVITGNSLGVGSLNQPSDMITGKDGCVYITDSKNNRIIKLSAKLEVLKVYDSFVSGEEKLTLNSPTNVFVTPDGTLYISDQGNRRVLVSDAEGKVVAKLEKPKSNLFPQEKEFLPMDVVVTQTGVIYVLCDGIYQGATIFDEKFEFIGFYGSNTVEPTLKVIADYFWKKFATKEQRSKMARYVPVQYSSLTIDDEDFVYVCVASAKDASSRVRKLNPLGNNVLVGSDGRKILYGDPMSFTFEGNEYNTVFESIAVSKNGIFAVLDRTGGKVFVYGQDGDLLTVIGGIGNQKGTFVDAIAVTFIDNQIAVLDGKKGEITKFSLTEYGNSVLEALEVYTDGRYAESLKLWEDVLKYNANSYLANLGYGKALYQIGEYSKAMEYFEIANDKQRYSDAYKEYRNQHLRDNYMWYLGGLVILIILICLCLKFKVFQKIIMRFKLVIRRRKEQKSHEIQ